VRGPARADAPLANLHRSAPAAPVRPRATEHAAPRGGPDIGWALACAGLLLAAGVIGLTDDGRKAAAGGRSRIAGVLRPLLGRR
jgi:hypothetical protein